MNEAVLYTAVSGIDEAYLTDSERMADIKAENQTSAKRKRVAAIGVCAGLVLLVGVVGILKHSVKPHNPAQLAGPTQQTPERKAQHALIPFAVAKTDPDADAYGEDELHKVTLTVQGLTYEQLRPDEAAAYGITQNIPDEAFGKRLGTVVESFPNQEPQGAVFSPEPSLAGADVYEFAPTKGRAVLIAEKDGHCSMFAVFCWPDGRTFQEICDFYGAEPSAVGIETISYTIMTTGEDDAVTETRGALTADEAINGVCAILLQLAPEDPPKDDRAPTPDWYMDAWEAYKADPKSRVREDITLEIRFANGCRIRDIVFQPFIGDGYVAQMKELSSAQTEALRSLLQGQEIS